MRVELWTDGSGMATGGPIGWAYVLRASHQGEILKQVEAAGGEDEGTNNRAELLAVIHGLEALTRPTTVEVVSDSQYAIGGYGSGWVAGWRRRGWLSFSTGEAVKNADLWERLGIAMVGHQVTWHHVKGHRHHWICECGEVTPKRPPGNDCTACDGGKPKRHAVYPLNDRCDQLAGAERRRRLPTPPTETGNVAAHQEHSHA